MSGLFVVEQQWMQRWSMQHGSLPSECYVQRRKQRMDRAAGRKRALAAIVTRIGQQPGAVLPLLRVRCQIASP